MSRTEETDTEVLDLTRSEAIHQARAHYALLIYRARETVGDDEYIRRLGEEWDRELARLANLGSALTIRPETATTLRRLIERSASPTISRDTLMEWLDAFPDAVADLFPPSAVTYRLVSAEGEARAGNRQPSLTLAA
jgi:truncated hemoglobin YjbI